MSPLTTKAQSLKLKSKTPWSKARRPKKPWKTQEGHLEEGKSQKSTKDTKSGKTMQNGTEELRNAQKSKKISKSTQKTQNQHTPLKLIPPNTLNASSPP
jgi:hypothetical protein